MTRNQSIEWVLRIAIAGEFIGHGVFALQGKEAWVTWISQLTALGHATASQVLPVIGLLDVLVALIILFRPNRTVLIWAAFWGFFTALVRPLVGEPFWDFVERWSNWGAPLALFLLRGGWRNAHDK